MPSAPGSDATPPSSAITAPGRNVWRVAHADRFGVLVDGAAYFETVARSLLQAERSIFILAWDIDSRVRLGAGVPDMPDELGPFLDELVRRRRHLDVYILSWAFSPVYMFEREAFPRLQLGARRHRRIHFELDGVLPQFAAHHQKVIVIDDALAFSGGIDLCDHRWDTPAHDARDPRRVTLRGEPYPPFHDVQAVVDGEAARALGELARERWHRATGEHVPLVDAGRVAWPASLAPDAVDTQIAIARTQGAYEGVPEVRENEQLYLDAIAAARRSIYIENQYVTSERVLDALRARLAERAGPEIVILGPPCGDGWIESQTVGAAHRLSLAALRDHDPHRRLRVLCAVVPADEGSLPVFIHSKILVVDERLLRVGSANLTNRSLGVDTECDLVLDAGRSPGAAGAIAAVRARLLAEHLGADVEAVAASIASRGLIATLEALGGGPRGLRHAGLAPLEAPAATAMAFADPERPVSPRAVLDATVAPEVQSRGRRRYLGVAALVAIAIGLVLLWHASPLSSGAELLRWAERWRGTPGAPALAIVFFALALQVFVPMNLLTLACVLTLGPWVGTACALAGVAGGAALGHALGGLFGRDPIRRLGGRRVLLLRNKLRERGFFPVLALRLVPVAPAQLVNLVAGAWAMPLVSFLAATLLGALPGVIAQALLGSRLAAVLARPGVNSLLSFLMVAVVLLVILLWTRSALRPRGQVPS